MIKLEAMHNMFVRMLLELEGLCYQENLDWLVFPGANEVEELP